MIIEHKPKFGTRDWIKWLNLRIRQAAYDELLRQENELSEMLQNWNRTWDFKPISDYKIKQVRQIE